MCHPGALLGRLGDLLDPSQPKKVANMAPSCIPKRRQNRLKTDPKIDHFFDASWDRFSTEFWLICKAQVSTKITSKTNVYLVRTFFNNRALAAAGARFLRFLELEVRNKIQ